jgi:DNA-directed RNA polymerase subunit omega
MARVSVEDCLEHVENHFAIVILAVQRARQLIKGAKPTVENSRNKASVLALREIASGHVYPEKDLEDVLHNEPE